MVLCTAALLVAVPAFPLAKGVKEAEEAKDQGCSCANTKYMSATNLQRHLNLKFDKAALPPSSKGFLAQLAGLQRMTDKREDAFRVTDLRRRAHGGAALHP